MEDGVKYQSTYFPRRDTTGTYIEKQPLSMKRTVSSARISTIPIFSRIIKENFERMAEFEIQVKKHGQRMDDKTEEEIAKSSIIVIVFSAMTVEAYIYDYASRHLGDTFVKDHLDKLDVISKWVIIPELITGKEMPRHENWYKQLAILIKVRNSIIHQKSSDLPVKLQDAPKYLKKLRGESDLIYETARQSMPLLAMLADKISEVDPEETPWVKSYLA